MKKEFDIDAFPNIIYAKNPIHVEGVKQSIYICNPRMLQERKDLVVPDHYRQFYYDIPAHLDAIAGKVTSTVLVEWMEHVKNKRAFFEIHDNKRFTDYRGFPYSPFFIQFTSCKDYHDWANHAPSYGISLELFLASDIPDELPNCLKELYQLGGLHLNGGFGMSGYFYHPQAAILPALEEEHLGNYISAQEGFPLEELKVFYHDSLTWLMYDTQEQVYASGFEFGGMMRSEYDLTTVIDNILRASMEKGSVFIEECVGSSGSGGAFTW